MLLQVGICTEEPGLGNASCGWLLRSWILLLRVGICTEELELATASWDVYGGAVAWYKFGLGTRELKLATASWY